MSLIREKTSNYSYMLKWTDERLTFDTIQKISNYFYDLFDEEIQYKLHRDIGHGVRVLSTEPELHAYMHDYGKMHSAKLKHAFDKLSSSFKSAPIIDIVDYGCGQAMGVICYSDFLHRNKMAQKVRQIVLIEPSFKALARASLHASLMFPNSKIITINKEFDDLTDDDLVPDGDIPKLHILSNVIDLGWYDEFEDDESSYDLERLGMLIHDNLKGYNEFVCICPFFNTDKDDNMDYFASILKFNKYYELCRCAGDFISSKNWTCNIVLGNIGAPRTVSTSLKPNKPSKVKLPRNWDDYNTFDKSLFLLKKGLSIEQIATFRELKSSTICGHIVNCIRDGLIDLIDYNLVAEKNIKLLKNYYKTHTEDKCIKDCYEYFEGEISYDDIRMVWAYLNR